MRRDSNLKARVEDIIKAEVGGDLNVYSLLEYLHDQVGTDAIRERVTKPLSGLKVIPFYGCYLVKPPKVTRFDEPENPKSLDTVLEALGAETLDWDFKAECCGAGLALSKTETVLELSGRLIREAEYRGADAMVVACQLCQANLDMRQGEIGVRDGLNHQMPVLYFTQLMGLSFGHEQRELGLSAHLVDPLPMLAEKGFV